MNDLFSAKRFVWFFKKTIAERPLQTAGAVGVLLVLSFITYVVAKKFMDFAPAQNLTFMWGLTGGGFFLSSFVFGYFGSNASGSSYLTLPVSFFEKWLCAILIAGILYPFIFLLFYHLMDAAFVAAFHRGLDPNSIFYKREYESVYTFNLTGLLARKVYSLFLLLAGCMLTGSLYFNKIPFIKTGIAICAAIFIIFGTNWLLAIALFNNVAGVGPYDHVEIFVGKDTAALILPARVERFFYIGVEYAMPGVLWFLPLLRLREKEF
jgi:hypothetical protein